MSFPPGYHLNTTSVSSGAEISSHYRRGSDNAGSKPLLMLLHGYPQNKSMWKDFINLIPSEWSIFVPDLPGYGNSGKISQDGSPLPFSKRAMAKDLVEAADKVHQASSPVPIIAYGHDRGGRVAYRMALDFPDRVVGLAVLDIIPTIHMWNAMRPENDHKETKISNHWVFLSSPKPLPETLIGNNPKWYYTWTMSAWSPKASEQPAWISDSIAPFLDNDEEKVKSRISAACNDYRAGATVDVDHDREQGIDPAKEAKAVFKVPVLVLASHHLRRRHDVDGIWKGIVASDHLQAEQIAQGHFLVNEEPEETAKATVVWLNKHWGSNGNSKI